VADPAGGVGVFAALVDAVYRLAPDAERISETNNDARMPTPITEETVKAWVIEVSDAVSIGIGPWGNLTGDTLERVRAAARAVVANGAASYLQAARYPTKSTLNDSSYAGVLWERYKEGLANLKALIAELLEDGGEDIVVPGAGSGGGFGSFPAPYFLDAPSQRDPVVLDGDEEIPQFITVVKRTDTGDWWGADS